MESYWEKSVERTDYPPLTEKTSADVCVIGGGIVGLCTAARMMEKGYGVVLLEARRLGSGATGGTTAKITVQHGATCYQDLIRRKGPRGASLHGQANREALLEYPALLRDWEVQCDYAAAPFYLYAATEQGVETLKREKDAHKRAGIESRWAEEALPFATKAALVLEDQAIFHPLKFVQGMARALAKRGCRIYEETRALRIDDFGRVHTPEGGVMASHVVIATHYPILDKPGMYYARMYQERSYACRLEGPKLCAMYFGVEEDSPSYRPAGEWIIASGIRHPTGKDPQGNPYQRLLERTRQQFGRVQSMEGWSAQDCMPYDGVPLIGWYGKSDDRRLVATVFQKWGMSQAMAAAGILSDLVHRGKSVYEELYRPWRVAPLDMTRGYLAHTGTLAASLAAGWMGIPSLKPESQGGQVVRKDGKRMGLYRNEFGEEFTIKAKCSHMGCGLKWNDAEKTWDCPCHGSRYDIHGNVLEAPAIRGIGEE